MFDHFRPCRIPANYTEIVHKVREFEPGRGALDWRATSGLLSRMFFLGPIVFCFLFLARCESAIIIDLSLLLCKLILKVSHPLIALLLMTTNKLWGLW